jgi:hypothetical protein
MSLWCPILRNQDNHKRRTGALTFRFPPGFDFDLLHFEILPVKGLNST